MTALIAGIDFSSRALHAALVPLDADHGSDCPPVTLRKVVLPVWKPASTTPQYRSVERCRLVRDAMRELLAPVLTRWVQYMDFSDAVAHVCVEEPHGPNRKADNVMRELYGAILASIPHHIARDTMTANEWRAIIWPEGLQKGDGDWKEKAIFGAFARGAGSLDEHAAEAVLIATAARERLDAACRKAS